MSLGRLPMPRILDLLLAIGELGWLQAWSVVVGAWLGGTREPLLPFPVLVAAIGVPIVLARLSSRPSRWQKIIRTEIVILGLVAALAAALAHLSLPPGLTTDPAAWARTLADEGAGRGFLAGCMTGLAWWRGLSLGSARPSVAAVEDSFGAGLLAILTLLPMAGLATTVTRLSPDELILPTMAVLVVGLVGMPLARVAEVGARPRHRQSPELSLGGPWLPMLLTVVAIILVVTLVLAKLFTFERIDSLLAAVGSATDSVLSTVIYILAIPFGLLAEAIFFLISLIPHFGNSQPRPRQPQLDPFANLDPNAKMPEMSPETLLAMKIFLGLLLAALLAWLLWRAVTRLQGRWGEDEADESRDSVWTWPGWSAVWASLIARIRPLGARAAVALGITSHATEEAERTPRGAYRILLRMGASIGHPRQLPETPLEYQARVASVVSEGIDDMATITDAYVQERYGPPSPMPSPFEPLAAALARLRAAWRSTPRIGR